MASNKIAGSLKRSALTVALGLCFAGAVQAQSSVGSIFGDTTANATVKIENLDTGTSREITSDSSGRFNFPQLAPGRYRVTSPSGTREVRVQVGTGTQVSFAAAPAAGELGTVTVVGNAGFNPIDVSSVESTTVFTAEQIDELPVSRDVTNVALLAPGTVRGDSGFGNLASFGGASVAENGYYINGFDVTNIRNFTSFAELPFDAIAEQQVKTGGYGAEYGRSLGGVINIVTKRGTNEWTGGVSAYWSPSSLREHGKDVISRDTVVAASADPYFVYRSANESDLLSYNVWGGGPLIKDRLFFFGMIEGRKDEIDTYGQTTSLASESNDPTGMLKLDWNITDNHILEFTGIWNKLEDEYTAYSNFNDLPSRTHDGAPTADYTISNGGEVYIAKYTGYLTDNFTLSAMAGYLLVDNNFQSELPGAECPPIYDSRDVNLSLNPIGCWNPSQFTIRNPDFGGGPDQDRRRAFRLDAEWRVGDHNLRFGVDEEKFTSSAAGVTYSGGGDYYRYFNAGTLFSPDYAFLGDLVRIRTTFRQSGSFEVINQAAYVEDNWQATENLLLYGGVRAETFENKNPVGQTFVESDTLLAPRIGFSWDVNGDSTFKVFGNAGRYYIPVASNTNIRASVAEESTEVWYYDVTIGPNGLPIYDPANVLFPLAVNGSRVAPDPRTVAANNLDPMYQDEFILGFQHQLGNDWSIGLRGIMREVKAGMDDVCSHNGFDRWAADNGFDPDFSQDGDGVDMATCFLLNPGKDAVLAMDPDNNGTLETYTVPASYIGLPEYQRKYHAVEFFWEKAKSNNWYLQGSYTFAKSKGNVEGYVNSTLEQDDAGVTQDFDFPAFEDGAYGYLPNDRRHTLKLFGAYDINDEWTVSANLLVQSGRPVNCNGFIPVEELGIGEPDAGSLGNYAGSSFYCRTVLQADGTYDYPRNANGLALPGSRGDHGRTPWTKSFDLGVSYTPEWASGKLSLQMKVFNVLNSQTVTEYNEASAAFSTQTDTDPDFLNDVNYQAPRFVRFTVRYQF